MQPTVDRIQAAVQSANNRWQSPFPGFTSGSDIRTSDNALLVHLYGGLEHAANNDWLNAGRRLIDKTYVDMLWHVQNLLPLRACKPESVAASLDTFITEEIKPAWPGLYQLDEAGNIIDDGIELTILELK